MTEKIFDENKVLIVIICNSREECEQQLKFFSSSKIAMTWFHTFTFKFLTVIKSGTLAKTCNLIQKESDSKYKVFITTPIAYFDPLTLSNMLWVFFQYPKVGIVGLSGTEMPLDGDYTRAKNSYGFYTFKDSSGQFQTYKANVPFSYQSVHIIDPGIFVTSQQILFDERMDDNFFMAAQCCRYRQEGYDVGVAGLPFGSVAFERNEFIYKPKVDVRAYSEQLKIFKDLYKDIVTPLVSIVIPTYNQPYFLEVALRSALSQTYENIEIIVGDDSTNEDTKKIIQPYLIHYKNIRYFYHGKPLGKKGGNNIRFVINKASGKYINILFHDDVIYPNKISRMMEYFVRDLENRITLIVSARDLINEKNQVLRRMNPYQPTKDIILGGEEVGRRILFSKINFLGELSTSLIKKESIRSKDPKTGEDIFDCGVFCGVKDVAYGDIGTWLNLLKNGGECVFIEETLSAFRQHSAQNTYDPFIQSRTQLDFMEYITVAWLNNVFFHSAFEYELCCQNWKNWVILHLNNSNSKNSSENTSANDIKKILTEMCQLIDEKKYPELLDFVIKFLLFVLDNDNAINHLIKRNPETKLLEKATNIVILHGEQRF